MSDARFWVGEALAAYDQSLVMAGNRDKAAFDDAYWLQRAQVAASIAQAEQARIANLIAWKQLRQTAAASTSSLPNAGDAISDEIETVLGITYPAVGD